MRGSPIAPAQLGRRVLRIPPNGSSDKVDSWRAERGPNSAHMRAEIRPAAPHLWAPSFRLAHAPQVHPTDPRAPDRGIRSTPPRSDPPPHAGLLCLLHAQVILRRAPGVGSTGPSEVGRGGARSRERGPFSERWTSVGDVLPPRRPVLLPSVSPTTAGAPSRQNHTKPASLSFRSGMPQLGRRDPSSSAAHVARSDKGSRRGSRPSPWAAELCANPMHRGLPAEAAAPARAWR